MSAKLELVKPRAKQKSRSEPEPQPSAEIVQFSTLQAKRAANTAEVAFTGFVVTSDDSAIKPGDIVLAQKMDGTYTLATVDSYHPERKTGKFTVTTAPNVGELKSIIGRVVLATSVVDLD